MFLCSQELKQLKQALKEDYEAQEEEMPVNFMKPMNKGERRKKKKKQKNILTKQVVAMIEVSVLNGSG